MAYSDYGEYRIDPPNILGALESVDRFRQRNADAEKDRFALEMARRKMAMEEAAGQYLPGALRGDEHALARLFSTDPQRGMAVVQWLATREDRALRSEYTRAMIDRLRAKTGGGGGVPGASPWGFGVPGAVPTPGSTAAPARTPPQGGVPAVQPQRTADASGSMDLTMPAVAGPPQGSSGGTAPTDMLPGPMLMREGSVNPPTGFVPPDAGPAAAPQRNPLDYGWWKEAQMSGEWRIEPDPRKPSEPLIKDGMVVMRHRSGAPGMFPLTPPKADQQWVPDPNRPGVLIDQKTGNVKRDPGFQDPNANPFGNSLDAKALGIVIRGDPGTPEYEAAYWHLSQPKVMPDGTMIRPDMRAFRPPTRFAQGAPAAPPAGAPTGGPPVAAGAGASVPVQSGAPPAGAPPVAPQSPPQAPLGTPEIVEPTKPRLGQAEQSKLRQMQMDVASLNHALDSYGRIFREAGTGERLRSVAGLSTNLNTAWTNAALLAKGEALYSLGVLNGPDLSIIRRAIADPSTLAGGAISPDELDQQIKQVRDLMMVRLNEWERRGGQPITPGGPQQGQPTQGAPPASGGDLRKKYGLE